MKSSLIPLTYAVYHSKELTKPRLSILSVFSHGKAIKPKDVYDTFPTYCRSGIYRLIYLLRDSGYLVQVRGVVRGFHIVNGKRFNNLRVSGLYRITPKGKKFMADFCAEMERIAERLEHGY